MLEKSQFSAWRNTEVYDEFRKQFQERIEAFAAEVMNRKAPDGPRDMYVRGVVAAFVEVLEWQPEFKEDQQAEVNDEI